MTPLDYAAAGFLAGVIPLAMWHRRRVLRLAYLALAGRSNPPVNWKSGYAALEKTTELPLAGFSHFLGLCGFTVVTWRYCLFLFEEEQQALLAYTLGMLPPLAWFLFGFWRVWAVSTKEERK